MLNFLWDFEPYIDLPRTGQELQLFEFSPENITFGKIHFHCLKCLEEIIMRGEFSLDFKFERRLLRLFDVHSMSYIQDVIKYGNKK